VRNCTEKASCFRSAQWGMALLLFGTMIGGSGMAGPTEPGEGTELYFIDVKDGATLPTRVLIRFGLRGMGLAPAGEDLAKEDLKRMGHHHLLIDTDLPPLDKPIPDDPNHLHFDNGQSEAEITLSPGPHTLQLILGDKDHVPHDPPVMSARIRVTATEGATAPAATAPAATPTPSATTPATAPAATNQTAPAATPPKPSAQRPSMPSPDAVRRRMERYMREYGR
jgi:hypothetical protein